MKRILDHCLGSRIYHSPSSTTAWCGRTIKLGAVSYTDFCASSELSQMCCQAHLHQRTVHKQQCQRTGTTVPASISGQVPVEHQWHLVSTGSCWGHSRGVTGAYLGGTVGGDGAGDAQRTRCHILNLILSQGCPNSGRCCAC